MKIKQYLETDLCIYKKQRKSENKWVKYLSQNNCKEHRIINKHTIEENKKWLIKTNYNINNFGGGSN